MATKVFMEALSPTMEEGRLVKWLKNEGDAVKSGEPIGEVETDKAIMELVARGDGVLRKRLINEGDSAPVGTLVGVIGAKDENIDALLSGGGAAPAAPAPTAAPQAGTPQQSTGPSKSEPAPAPAAAPKPAATPAPVPAAAASAPQQSAPSGNGESVRSSPLARRMASERGLNLGGVQGSGPGGRIIKRDIEAAASAGAGATTAPRAAAAPSAPTSERSSRSGSASPSGPFPPFISRWSSTSRA
jgi:pyruvate dehydrogenase E2 component (dihydrolipoamide acetyltransferase)